MKKILSFLLVIISLAVSLSCTEKEKAAEFDVQFVVPEQMELKAGDTEMSFRVEFGKAPLMTDVILLGESGTSLKACNITSVTEKKFSIALYSGFKAGKYSVYIQRDNQKKLMGTTTVTFVKSPEEEGIKLEKGNNVYGVVSSAGKGVPGVVVSDGYEVVQTDADGVYQFKSNKSHGYVFISVPSGYEVAAKGVLPQFHKQFTKSRSEVEKIDFSLAKVSGQDNHRMLVFGDIHLAARTNDATQFREFVSDVNTYLAANSDKRTYALTLGDMTWELYWYTNKYGFEEYIKDANNIKGIQIFHTIGNHDHEMAEGIAGDFDTVKKYKKMIAPTYYSFNIGKVHYIVMDDIECKNTGAGNADSRKYVDALVQEQLEWLKKDLAFVTKDTPLVIAMHAPVYNDSEGASLDNTSAFEDIVKDYPMTHIWTGHTHKMYNVDKASSKKIFEHNAGAVCATWWWTGNYTKGIHVAQDGAPGGYSVVNVTGTDFNWQFKSTYHSLDHQFRTYDRNSMALTAANFVASNKSDSDKKKFEDAAGDWKSSSSENYVYINVWNYDPQWTISVTENGQELKVDKVSAKDPLHLIAYNAKTPGGGFGTSTTKHMFRVQASSATSTLDIKVTDRFGNIYTETMVRPKAFSLDIYK